MPLGDFLVAYLKRAGVTHLFGLPGDLVLGLFHRFGEDRDLAIVTFSHEPSVGFAADGYARSTRRLGVVCVTWGAGGHNVLNPVAGAYAEQVPLLVVSGGPGDAERKLSGIHHQAKDVEGQWRMFREVTVDARILRHPERAAEEVHEVVRAIMTEHRPGYLEIHRDLVDVADPDAARDPRVERRDSPPRRRTRASSREAVADTAARLRAAKRPVLIGGIEAYRDGAERDFARLAERLGVAVVTTPDAKGCVPDGPPAAHGDPHGTVLAPRRSRSACADADLVLAMGTVLTDMNLGAARPQVRRERAVWAVDGRVNVSFHTYTEVALRDFVGRARTRAAAALPRAGRLLRQPEARGEGVARDEAVRQRSAARDEPLSRPASRLRRLRRIGRLALRRSRAAAARRRALLLAELLRVDGLRGAGRDRCADRTRPAHAGALAATARFQMTGPEISHAPRHGVAPIVVLVNNSGWQIFRPVSPRPDLLAIPPWPYAELAQAWGGVGFQAETRGELREALRAAHERASSP